MRKRRIAAFVMCAVMQMCPVITMADDVAQTQETMSAEGTSAKSVKTGLVPQTLQTPPDIIADAAIVVDMATGYTLYEKNIQIQEYPASITKIMTATLVLENLNMDEVVTFSHDAVYTIEPGSSSAYAEEGEQLTVEQCLYGLMLISGNDLANALGEKVSGSMDAFAQKMTEKAAELGCIGTQFKNAHGLHDEGHYTTAYDMAIIAMNAWKSSETFQKVCSTVRYDVPPTNMCNETRYWLNNNRMIRQGEEYYYADCIGGKTGFTNEAGGTLVTFANLNGRQVVCVVLKSTNSASAYSDTIKLYDYIKANAVQTDYDVLDAKVAEEASIAAAQAESISNAQTTTTAQKESTAVQEKEKKNAKGFSMAGKVLLAAAVIIAVAYFYVSYRRYQARQRKLARRRQMDREKREHYYEQKRIDHELEKRKNKYRNYDFSDKNNRR